jgi:SPP1 gp7 family putative phage head morphogenesis protein
MANRFEAPRGIERRYAVELRKVARIVAGIITSHVDGAKIRDQVKMDAALKAYAEALGPWSERIVSGMVKSVEAYNKRAYLSQSKKVGESFRRMFEESATGAVARMLQQEQVALIKSLPIEAGLRAQTIAQQAALGGKRADEAAAEIARTEGVTVNRATLIARTETAKANAAITQARSEYVGATHYIWRTAGDGDVRESHREVDGKIFAFMAPPTLSDGMTGNPGEFPNCRCFAEPIIPE